MSIHKANKYQNQADISTFICIFSLGILAFLFANQPSGMEALYLIIPMFIVGFLHVSLGIQALYSAIRTGSFWRNIWIYCYFGTIIILSLGYAGVFRALQQAIMEAVGGVQKQEVIALYQHI